MVDKRWRHDYNPRDQCSTAQGADQAPLAAYIWLAAPTTHKIPDNMRKMSHDPASAN